MSASSRQRKQIFVAAVQDEFDDLRKRGVLVAGNVLSTVLLVKGDLNESERSGGELLGGADGTALRAALLRLGYGPEDFCALSAVLAADVAPLGASGRSARLRGSLLREAVEAADPETVMVLDAAAAEVMREAYAEALARDNARDVANLQPGVVVSVLGRRVLALDGFEAALADEADKQRMWAQIKQLPPLGSPY